MIHGGPPQFDLTTEKENLERCAKEGARGEGGSSTAGLRARSHGRPHHEAGLRGSRRARPPAERRAVIVGSDRWEQAVEGENTERHDHRAD